MTDEVYHKLAKVLDALPNGFPSTESGIEIKLLKRIFKPDDVELFCDLKLTLETPEQIASRTGRPIEGLEEKLTSMWERGQIFGVKLGPVKLFRIAPWALGIYEFQLPHMDRELAAMCEEYGEVYGRQILGDLDHVSCLDGQEIHQLGCLIFERAVLQHGDRVLKYESKNRLRRFKSYRFYDRPPHPVPAGILQNLMVTIDPHH
jgi:hypothetical protein